MVHESYSHTMSPERSETFVTRGVVDSVDRDVRPVSRHRDYYEAKREKELAWSSVTILYSTHAV